MAEPAAGSNTSADMPYGSRSLLRQCCIAAAVLSAVVALARLQGAAGIPECGNQDITRKVCLWFSRPCECCLSSAVVQELRALHLSATRASMPSFAIGRTELEWGS